jgi:AcrR family transcriptional regulator
MLPEILEAGIAVAREVGYRNVTRPAICKRLKRSANWLQYRCPLKTLTDHLEANAEQLSLIEGESGATSAKLSGIWATSNKARILVEAYKLAEQRGFKGFNRNAVAAAAGVAAGVINLRWGSMPGLLDEVAREAVRCSNTDLLRQAQAVGNQIAVDYFKGA